MSTLSERKVVNSKVIKFIKDEKIEDSKKVFKLTKVNFSIPDKDEEEHKQKNDSFGELVGMSCHVLNNCLKSFQGQGKKVDVSDEAVTKKVKDSVERAMIINKGRF